MANKPTGILVCAVLFAIGGIFLILGGLGMFLMGGSLLGLGSDAAVGAGIFGILGIGFLVVGILYLAIAYGMWNLKNWARIPGIILAVIGLLNIPIGTIISIVILYYLLINDETKNLFK